MSSRQPTNRKRNFQYSSPCQYWRRECWHELDCLDYRRLYCLEWCLYLPTSVDLCDLIIASYAELGSAIPVNGGSFAYLHYVYGPLPAFLFSWTTIMST